MSGNSPILPPATIGILGGGQLGRMIALEARRMGYGIAVLDPTPGCPASHLADRQIQADFDDSQAVQELAAVSEILTFEFENVEPGVMEGLSCHPSLEPLYVTRNRWREKNMARGLGIPTAPFLAVGQPIELRQALATEEIRKRGGAILKTCEGGYDGKGQWRFNERAIQQACDTNFTDSQFLETLEPDLRALFQNLANGGTQTQAPEPFFVLEGMVPFSLEFSIVGTGFADSQFAAFAPVENEHRNGILHKSFSSAAISSEQARRAIEYAGRIAEHFGYVGTFAVEFFLADGEPVFNEMAPRPHNSGHLTLDASISSQFEQHVRAVCHLPPGSPDYMCEAVMINLIGEDHSVLAGVERALEIPGIRFHWYGKSESRAGRKMGHITALASTRQEASENADRAYDRLKWVRQ
ncbi:MAG: 5-(carboxyamino)imidazole ribonucleotide synthase [Spirochaetaceae bacterium]|nr:5-(carboxyamino)imidazole ribonucleotide synthase [Spirochaetaceae bacterium]